MRPRKHIVFFLILFSLFIAPGLSAQVKVILDTDPGYDPDDVGCMAMLHTMANAGECEILAMVNSTDHQESPLALSAINTYYNRPGIPVGDYKGYPKKVPAPKAFYSHHLANAYPHQLESWEDSKDAVALYREILASAEDTSIIIVITGTMHNFYGLLQSAACKYSDWNGIELVREKVKKVVTMGGNFINGQGYDRTNWGGSDLLCAYTSWSCLDTVRNAMCRYVIDNCPAPFIASGWEVGCGDYHDAGYGNVITGPGLKNLAEDHIARVSYEYHFKHRENSTDISRHSNDQCALHYAIRGEGENYDAFLNGQINLSAEGVCTWTPTPNRDQGYIQKKRDKNLIAAEIEMLMMGDIPARNTTPPGMPGEVTTDLSDGILHLKWKAALDETPGSWVVGYKIYQDKQMVDMVYGTQVLIENITSGSYTFEIRALNAAGVEGDSKVLQVEIP